MAYFNYKINVFNSRMFVTYLFVKDFFLNKIQKTKYIKFLSYFINIYIYI